MRFRCTAILLAAGAAALLVPPAATARLAVVTTGKSTVAVVDLSSRKVLARPVVGLRSKGIAMSSDGLSAYVVSGDRRAGLLSVIDLSTRQVVAKIPVPAAARQVAVSEDGARAYVTAGGRRGRIAVVDLVARVTIAEIATPRSPDAIAISPGSTRAYITSGANRFAVVDLTQLARTRTTRVGRKPVDLAVDRLRNLVYVTNRAGKSVSVVNPATVRVARTFRVKRPVGGIVLLGDGSRAVVGQGKRSRKPFVIHTRSGRRLQRISAGRWPG